MHISGGQVLLRSQQHVVTGLFRKFPRLQSKESSLNQVIKVCLIADSLHIGLSAAVIDPLRQSLQSLGHQHVLPVGSLPLPDHASTYHSLEVELGDSLVSHSCKLLIPLSEGALPSLDLLPASKNSNHQRNQVPLLLLNH